MDEGSSGDAIQGLSWLNGEVVRLRADGRDTADLIGQTKATIPATRQPRELLAWARERGQQVPKPGTRETAERWELLATIAAGDLVAARVLEPHLDALAILAESAQPLGPDLSDATWGVWAAEGPHFRN